MRLGIAVVLACAVTTASIASTLIAPRSARADDGPTATTRTDDGEPPAAARPAAGPRHAVYLEMLGKGGLWGLGYAYQLRPRLAIGAVGSFMILDGQRITSFSPSVTAYPLGSGRHRWFVDLGPQVVRVSTPSPVPEWMGTSSTGVGAQLATGYEYRAGVLLRVFAMAVSGGDGAMPWIGADAGWTF